jgi:TM2 domain-containing membrane protein YozV
MKGKILNYDAETKSGVISGDDGNRYKFQASAWKPANEPRNGGKVDYLVNGDSATEIYADGAIAGGESKKISAALIALFLGPFGGHKFYLGYNVQGIIMLLVFLFGLILLGIPSLIIGFIAFIEFILYLKKSDEEFEQTYVIGRKPWF